MNSQQESSAQQRVTPALGGLATGVGSLPYSDMAAASRVVFEELGDLPFVPELPGRGPHAGIIGRGVALLTSIDVDLVTSGWRIGSGEGLERRRAAATLVDDLDGFEAVANGVGSSGSGVRFAASVLKTQVVGPLTLAAGLELPGGQAAIADPGARRDVAQSLAEGVRAHLAGLEQRFGVPVVLQLDEPSLPAVLTGNVRRPSGFGRYPALEAERASRLLAEVLRSAGDTGPLGAGRVRTVVHCCADTVPVELLVDAGTDAIGFDLSRTPLSAIDEYAMAVDSGCALFVGAIPGVPTSSTPSNGSVDTGGTQRSAASRILDWWRQAGFDEELAAERIVVTTTCGSAGAEPDEARRALGTAQQAAAQLAS